MWAWNPFDGLARVDVLFRSLHPEAKMPTYGSEEAAGADLSAVMRPEDYPSPITRTGDRALAIEPGEQRIIGTGVAIELPKGFEAQVRPRSGLAAKHGITVLNTPGTIDSDYRGEIKVILLNTSRKCFYVNPGDRIAQLVVVPIFRARFLTADGVVRETKRGEDGLGSTGISGEISKLQRAAPSPEDGRY